MPPAYFQALIALTKDAVLAFSTVLGTIREILTTSERPARARRPSASTRRPMPGRALATTNSRVAESSAARAVSRALSA